MLPTVQCRIEQKNFRASRISVDLVTFTAPELTSESVLARHLAADELALGVGVLGVGNGAGVARDLQIL